jgi:crotonobetainyl-CoA:carnitine CoA-transferase CaiB-like acyl-CoA transferase
VGALAGLRVVDLANLLAAPLVSAVLADLGADVVKVEPPEGDPLARLGVRRGDTSAPYLLANRGKRVVRLHVQNERDDLHRLLDAADVIVANQPITVLRDWGADPDTLLARNPRAVVITVSCYGTDGPWGERVGNGSLAEAFGGLTYLTGNPGSPPMLPSVALGDSLVSFAGALAAVAACWSRDVAGGSGQHIDVAQFEPVLALLGPAVVAWTPGDRPPERTGSRVPGGVPRNVYEAGDGRFLVLSATTDAQVARVMDLLGIEGRERYATSDARLEHADELDDLVARWISSRRRDDVLAAFDGARLPAVAVQDLREVAAHPQVVARGSLTDVGGSLLPGPFAQLRGTPAVLRPAPAEPTSLAQILGEWSG